MAEQLMRGGQAVRRTDGQAFREALSDLRRRGCNILLIGDLSENRKLGLRRRHLGEGDERHG